MILIALIKLRLGVRCQCQTYVLMGIVTAFRTTSVVASTHDNGLDTRGKSCRSKVKIFCWLLCILRSTIIYLLAHFVYH